MYCSPSRPILALLTSLAIWLVSPSAFALDIQVYALFRDMAIIKIDGQQRQLKAGQVSPEGVKLVRATSEHAVLEVFGKQQSYSLGTHISSVFPEPERDEARVWQQNGMYLTPGYINGQPVDFMVDTGATWIAMNEQQASQLGIEYIERGTPGWASTANGNTRIYKVMLDQVKVGDILLHNVMGTVMTNSSPGYILLGNSFLNRVDMQREGQMMLLREKF